MTKNNGNSDHANYRYVSELHGILRFGMWISKSV